MTVNSWDTLEYHARLIIERYANAEYVQELRDRRAPEERRRAANHKALEKAAKKTSKSSGEKALVPAPEHIKIGDMVFENAQLCLRDLLHTREFADTVKASDPGRMLIMVKLWACAFRVNGRTTYAREMLHFIHDFTHVWPKPLRYLDLRCSMLRFRSRV